MKKLILNKKNFEWNMDLYMKQGKQAAPYVIKSSLDDLTRCAIKPCVGLNAAHFPALFVGNHKHSSMSAQDTCRT